LCSLLKICRVSKEDGVVKSPIYCVIVAFRKLNILYMYAIISEKPLRLFIPLIFSGGIWNFILSHLKRTPILFTKASTLGLTQFYHWVGFKIFQPVQAVDICFGTSGDNVRICSFAEGNKAVFS